MGRPQEDHTAYEGERFEVEQLAEPSFLLRCRLDFVQRPIGSRIPQPIFAVYGCQLGDQSAHAVANHHHFLHRRIDTLRIVGLNVFLELAAQHSGRFGKRTARGISITHYLISIA